jgi:hypothetical protein
VNNQSIVRRTEGSQFWVEGVGTAWNGTGSHGSE